MAAVSSTSSSHDRTIAPSPDEKNLEQDFSQLLPNHRRTAIILQKFRNYGWRAPPQDVIDSIWNLEKDHHDASISKEVSTQRDLLLARLEAEIAKLEGDGQGGIAKLMKIALLDMDDELRTRGCTDIERWKVIVGTLKQKIAESRSSPNPPFVRWRQARLETVARMSKYPKTSRPKVELQRLLDSVDEKVRNLRKEFGADATPEDRWIEIFEFFTMNSPEEPLSFRNNARCEEVLRELDSLARVLKQEGLGHTLGGGRASAPIETVRKIVEKKHREFTEKLDDQGFFPAQVFVDRMLEVEIYPILEEALLREEDGEEWRRREKELKERQKVAAREAAAEEMNLLRERVTEMKKLRPVEISQWTRTLSTLLSVLDGKFSALSEESSADEWREGLKNMSDLVDEAAVRVVVRGEEDERGRGEYAEIVQDIRGSFLPVCNSTVVVEELESSLRTTEAEVEKIRENSADGYLDADEWRRALMSVRNNFKIIKGEVLAERRRGDETGSAEWEKIRAEILGSGARDELIERVFGGIEDEIEKMRSAKFDRMLEEKEWKIIFGWGAEQARVAAEDAAGRKEWSEIKEKLLKFRSVGLAAAKEWDWKFQEIDRQGISDGAKQWGETRGRMETAKVGAAAGKFLAIEETLKEADTHIARLTARRGGVLRPYDWKTAIFETKANLKIRMDKVKGVEREKKSSEKPKVTGEEIPAENSAGNLDGETGTADEILIGKRLAKIILKIVKSFEIQIFQRTRQTAVADRNFWDEILSKSKSHLKSVEMIAHQLEDKYERHKFSKVLKNLKREADAAVPQSESWRILCGIFERAEIRGNAAEGKIKKDPCVRACEIYPEIIFEIEKEIEEMIERYLAEHMCEGEEGKKKWEDLMKLAVGILSGGARSREGDRDLRGEIKRGKAEMDTLLSGGGMLLEKDWGPVVSRVQTAIEREIQKREREHADGEERLKNLKENLNFWRNDAEGDFIGEELATLVSEVEGKIGEAATAEFRGMISGEVWDTLLFPSESKFEQINKREAIAKAAADTAGERKWVRLKEKILQKISERNELETDMKLFIESVSNEISELRRKSPGEKIGAISWGAKLEEIRERARRTEMGVVERLRQEAETRERAQREETERALAAKSSAKEEERARRETEDREGGEEWEKIKESLLELKEIALAKSKPAVGPVIDQVIASGEETISNLRFKSKDGKLILRRWVPVLDRGHQAVNHVRQVLGLSPLPPPIRSAVST